jgi:NAD(P)H-nitrite reductase large subunit
LALIEELNQASLHYITNSSFHKQYNFIDVTMPIVCTCNAVSREEITAAIKSGARTVEEVMTACKADLDCGSCQYHIEDMIEEYLETINN